jgi:hypothetical protein
MFNRLVQDTRDVVQSIMVGIFIETQIMLFQEEEEKKQFDHHTKTKHADNN